MKTTPQSTREPRVRKDYLIPDALWNELEPLLPKHVTHHPLGCHRKRVDDRSPMNAIFFVLKTGCQWNALNATGICSSSSAHRRFQEWNEAGGIQKTLEEMPGAIRRIEGHRLELLFDGWSDDKSAPWRGKKEGRLPLTAQNKGQNGACSLKDRVSRSALPSTERTAMISR